MIGRSIDAARRALEESNRPSVDYEAAGRLRERSCAHSLIAIAEALEVRAVVIGRSIDAARRALEESNRPSVDYEAAGRLRERSCAHSLIAIAEALEVNYKGEW